MIYRFGLFEFDAGTGSLRKSGRSVALEPQPARALAHLLARAGDIVTRDELKAAVWDADVHVDFDRGLAYCLARIRAALGDSGENPRFVRTVPKQGYAFIAPVVGPAPTPVGEAGAPAARPRMRWLLAAASVGLLAAISAWVALRSAPATTRAVIAVSVFDNESGQPEHDRLVAGLSDLVVTRLANLDPTRLAVIGNAAVLRQPRSIRNLKTIAAAVQADYVVLGQLQQSDSGLRFITHLIRLADGTHLKANRLSVLPGAVAGLEHSVVNEFERAVRQHVLGQVSSRTDAGRALDR